MDTILVLGHSFVKRLDYFTKDRTLDWAVHGKKLKVSMIGHGGLRTHDLQKWARNCGHSFLNKAAVVILAIGCNDVTMRTTSNDVVSSMIRTVQEVKCYTGTPSVVISQLMPRFLTRQGRCSNPDYVAHYNSIIQEVNATLAEQSQLTSMFKFWTHDLVNYRTNFKADGIHLSEMGNAKFLRSLRKAVCCGCRKELLKVVSRLAVRKVTSCRVGCNYWRPLTSVATIPQHFLGPGYR